MDNNKTPLPTAGVSVSFREAIKNAAIWVPVILAFLLLLSTLNSGLQRDDFMHRALLLGEPVLPGIQKPALGPLEAANRLFSFATSDSDLVEKAKAYGNAPWWTDNDLKVNFWRPLSALTHWLDYQLWPGSPALMHLHSLIWYALVGVLLGVWLLRLGISKVALWAVMGLYMLDAGHIHAISWLANRNILLATCFGLLSLLALQKWDHTGGFKFSLIALVMYLLSLLSAEAGISVFGLVVAYLLILSPMDLKKRGFLIVGFVAITLGWRLVYNWLGYGSLHSGFYLDPLNDSANFIKSLFINGPIMLYEQVVRVPSLSMLMSPAVEINQVIISFVILLITALLFIPLLKSNRVALFGLLAAVLAVAPACATVVTGGRLMFVFGIGVCLCVGLWFAGVIQKASWFDKGKIFKGFAYLWSAVLALAIVGGTGFMWYGKIAGSLTADKPKFNIYTDVVSHSNQGDSEDNIIVLINPPLLFEFMYVPLMADYYQVKKPTAIVSLVPGLTQVNVKQIDKNKLQITNEQGFLISAQSSWYQKDLPQNDMAFLFKRVDKFFVSNHKNVDYLMSYSSPHYQVSVEASTALGDPKQLVATLQQPLSSDVYRFLVWSWENNQYQQVSVAQLAQGITLSGPF